MPESAFETQNIATVVKHPNWGAIWAGVFTFIAIWSVFGLLGTAIFASAANPAAEHPVSGMSVGMSIWAIILTIIAMYVAGRATGHLAGIGNSQDGVIHGIIMFGLSVMSALVVTVLATFSMGISAAPGAVGGAHSPYLLNVFADLGWVGFAALFLGWLAAMGGAASGIRRDRTEVVRQPQVRQAA
jgi:hypothetical protein